MKNIKMTVFLGINFGFFTSHAGMLKLFELLLGSCCETLLLKFGMNSSKEIGEGTFINALIFYDFPFTIVKINVFLLNIYSFPRFFNNSFDMSHHDVYFGRLLLSLRKNGRSCSIVDFCKKL
jgi:hypothetical protein